LLAEGTQYIIAITPSLLL